MNERHSAWRMRLSAFSVVWLVVTSGGVFFNSQSVTPITLMFNVALVILLLLTVPSRRLSRMANEWAVLALLIVLVVISVMANGDYASLLSYARLCLTLVLAFSVCALVPVPLFAKVFVKTVVVISAVSLALFYTDLVISYSSLFPVIEFYQNNYINAFVYLSLDGLEQRNLAIFIEPGLFQIYINIALFLVLFSGGEIKYRFAVVLLLLVTLYSTNSTTGFILGVLIVGGFAALRKTSGSSVVPVAVNFIIGASIVAGVLGSDLFVENIENKFAGDSQKSFITRQNSTLIDLILIGRSPFVGGGVGSYQDSLNQLDSGGLEIDAATNTFSQLGAVVGLPFLLIVFFRSVFFIFKSGLGVPGAVILAVVYFVSFSTEPFVLYPFFYVPVFMGRLGLGRERSSTFVE